MKFCSTPESYFALAKDKMLLASDEWQFNETTRKYDALLTNDPQKAYTLRNRERAQFHLDEYESRLPGFRVVEIVETVVRTYKMTNDEELNVTVRAMMSLGFSDELNGKNSEDSLAFLPIAVSGLNEAVSSDNVKLLREESI